MTAIEGLKAKPAYTLANKSNPATKIFLKPILSASIPNG
jgi:hypothetical protein